MTEIRVALLNYKGGGRQPDGTHNFTKLQDAFADIDPVAAPDIIAITEAKGWEAEENRRLHTAANALADLLGQPYVGQIGHPIRGDATTPALFYNPASVRLDAWGNRSAANADKRNIALMHPLGRAATQFCVAILHWDPDHGDLRIAEARSTKSLAYSNRPTLLAGDLNNPASGPHIDMDWEQATPALRASKAMRLPNGKYVADTRAMDIMLGDWNPNTRSRTNYVHALGQQALGWHAVPELAYASGTPGIKALIPTVNRGIDAGGGLLIDWLLLNNAWKDGLVPGTYTVHVPPGNNPEDYPSDHRLVTATLQI